MIYVISYKPFRYLRKTWHFRIVRQCNHSHRTTMSQPNYGPSGESSLDIFWEKTWMAGTYLAGVALGMCMFTSSQSQRFSRHIFRCVSGVQFVVYWISAQALWKRKDQTSFCRFLLGFITILTALNCTFVGVNAFGLQQAYIDMREFPGGPWAYLQATSSGWVDIVSEVTFYIGNAMCDGLLVSLR